MSDHLHAAEPAANRPSQGRFRSARRLLQRKHRVESGLFLAEGPQAVREALAHGSVTEVWVEGSRESRSLARDERPGSRSPSERSESRSLARTARDAGVPVFEVTPAELKTVCDTVTPQGIVAVCHSVDTELDAIPADARLVVVCAQVRDPGNAGTVIRCADAFGADAVILSADSVELHNPKIVRASVGSIFHLPIVTGADLENTLGFLRDRGMRVLAADGGGTRDLDAMLDSGDLAAPTAWVMGNEAWGLPPEHAALADEVVSVPLHGLAESLNLATAAAVCLHASAYAQRR
ncbi:TrmH family RNA methyltransferase [Mariniluteicoccus flavus]